MGSIRILRPQRLPILRLPRNVNCTIHFIPRVMEPNASSSSTKPVPCMLSDGICHPHQHISFLVLHQPRVGRFTIPRNSVGPLVDRRSTIDRLCSSTYLCNVCVQPDIFILLTRLCRITRHNHSVETLNATWMLPIVAPIVASSAGGLLAYAWSTVDPYKALMTVLVSATMVIMGLSLALMMVGAILSLFSVPLLRYLRPLSTSSAWLHMGFPQSA